MSEYIVHPNYDERGGDFDFAIVTLTNPILLDNRAVPACLPPKSWGEEFLVGKKLTISGWGFTSEGGEFLSDILRSVNVPGISNSECRSLYVNSLHITDQMICAGQVERGGTGGCIGDSGGNTDLSTL